jgi:hypothetical protein
MTEQDGTDWECPVCGTFNCIYFAPQECDECGFERIEDAQRQGDFLIGEIAA